MADEQEMLVGQKPPVVAILFPTRGTNCTEFTMALADLMGFTGTQLVSQRMLDLTLANTEGTYIASNRQDLAEYAMQVGADYILWLDDDMEFPRDALMRLWLHNESIVGANYTTRKMPVIPLAILDFDDEGKEVPRLLTTEKSRGLQQVAALGFGCLLMHTDVLKRIEPPWFENYWRRDLHRWVGEDIDFFRKVRAAGIKVYVDHDLSKEIGHVGKITYKMDQAEMLHNQRVKNGNHDLLGVTDGDSELVEPNGPDGSDPRVHLVGREEVQPERGVRGGEAIQPDAERGAGSTPS
jgi:hypothetical protein